MREKRKKLLSGGTALICALAVLISGTLAWQAASQAINPFSGGAADSDLTGANLHDDFAGDKTGTNAGDLTKRVFVENTGDKAVFVRIKLSEQLDGGAINPFVPTVGVAPTYTIGDAGNVSGFNWVLGKTGTHPYKSIKTSTKWSGSGSAGSKTGFIADALGDGANLGTAYADTKGTTTGNTQAVTGSGVISMKAYTAMTPPQKVAYVGWIYDADGYAYWSKALAKDTATGLLLSQVSVPGNREYDYNIIVDMEYVDYLDLTAWTAPAGSDEAKINAGPNVGGTTVEASDDAKALLRDIATGADTGAGGPDDTKYNKNLVADLTDYVLKEGAVDQAPPEIKDGTDIVAILAWESSDATVISVNPKTGELTAVGAVGEKAEITGVDVYGNKVKFELEIAMDGLPDGIVEGEDGNYWQDNGDNTFTKVDPEDDYNPKSPEEIIWGGDDEKPGNADDKDVIIGADNKPYVVDEHDANVFYPVIQDGANKGELGGAITGGPTNTPGNGDGKTAPELVFDEDNNTWYLDQGDGKFTGPGPDGMIDTADDEANLHKITDADEAKTPPASDFDLNNDGYLNPAEKDAWDTAVAQKEEDDREAEEAAEKARLNENLTAALKADVVTNGYIGKPGLVETIHFATMIESPTNKYLIPYYATPFIGGSQQPGTLEDNYSRISVNELLNIANEHAANVVFTTIDSKIVEIKDGTIYTWWLPDHEDYMVGWLADDRWGFGDYRTTVTVTATYVDPDNADKKSDPTTLEIHVPFEGIFLPN